MKVLLISPERERKKDEAFLFRLGFLNLPYVAALTTPDVEVKIVDEAYEPINFDEKVDLVGITAQTPVAPRAYQIAEEFRKRGVTVVMGGVHASVLPQEALEHVDAVVIGEAEVTWPQCLDDFRRGRLKRIYRANGWVREDEIPLPRRELLNSRFYFPLKLLETTRGCPHQCDFCQVSRFFGNQYRNRPLKEIAKELEAMFGSRPLMAPWAKKFLSFISRDLPYFLKRRLLYIIDNNVVPDRKFAIELLSLLKNYDLLWWGHTPVSIADDDELLQLFAASGCIAVNIGFESLSPKNLKIMRKGFNKPHRYSEAVRKIHGYGIGIMGTFIVGLDDDDPGVFQRTLDFIEESKLDWALAFIMTPYPGTESFERLEREGRLLTRDWWKYDSLNAVYQPLLMSVEELEKGMRFVWKETFSLRSIFQRIVKAPRIHPLFYLPMNWSFHRLTRNW
ncbi:MAG: B12-binding domain-containing radical SAM protein [Deltaproteobacteria bacterium]|nr:MAG: B12-binding domain-containing radical SAM protein [Deltaproteobacteria bacterium]